ncbi:MAG: hypothetical protein WBC07_00355 [Methylotenera sp.]
MKKIALSTSLIAATFLTASISLAQAEQPVKTTSKAPVKVSYTEDQFLTAFSGKMKNVVVSKLGNPAKKEMSVKPAGASGFLGKVGADEKNSKRVNVEMWYYKNLVNYDPKNKYKETEITFVNDKVMNIAFFNNR